MNMNVIVVVLTESLKGDRKEILFTVFQKIQLKNPVTRTGDTGIFSLAVLKD